jgi:lipoprotein-anchoring transpeptidase ErfK/SrfK
MRIGSFRHIMCIIPFLYFTTPAAAERIIKVNFTTAELTVVDDGVVLFSTQVVLPAGDFYPVPVRGVVYQAEMGPSWRPTERTRQSKPGKYKAFYGPYEPGNAMGACKISIQFENAASYPIMNTVRIHGNAREQDLRQRLSRSCIRIPDSLCQELIAQTQGQPTSVYFHR